MMSQIKKICATINALLTVQKLKSLQRKLFHRRVSLYIFISPNSSIIKNMSQFERERLAWNLNLYNIAEEYAKIKQLFGEECTKDYISGLFDGGFVVEQNGKKIVLDYQNEYVHIINSKRITTEQPSVFGNEINIYGACMVRGTGVEDRQTISSYLQKAVNNKYPDRYRVINNGIGRGSTIQDDIDAIMRTRFRSGDIAIICNDMSTMSLHFCAMFGLNINHLSKLFDRPHDYGEWFTDHTVHTNSVGNRVIADEIIRVLGCHSVLSAERLVGSNKAFALMDIDTFKNNKELEKYKDYLKSLRIEDYMNRNVGAIVMNCNPFTRGHKYLIEESTKKVDTLYIFVVEEDRSFFPFEERLKLVKKGTADLDNVIVIPSGKFIISAVTFPGYFYKDNNNTANVDCANDIDIFGRHIAPILNIKCRFVGEEPFDLVTRKYNEVMAEMLPTYGIDFDVIERLKEDNEAVSASKVRKLLNAGEYEVLKRLVPDVTYEYLMKKFVKDDKEHATTS